MPVVRAKSILYKISIKMLSSIMGGAFSLIPVAFGVLLVDKSHGRFREVLGLEASSDLLM